MSMSPKKFQKAPPSVDIGGRPLSREKMGPMMSRQKELPSIPVAPLQETLDRYLKSLKLLLTTEQFEETQKLIVGENGHSGILFEPTPIDGGVRLALADHCCDYIMVKFPNGQHEVVSMRQFAHGRVAAVNCTSFESLSLCRAFEGQHFNRSERFACLKEATRTHKQEVLLAKAGLAIGPLLLGMKEAAREYGMATPAFYQDEGYRISTHMKMCSSQVPARSQSFITFGPWCHDGYGVFYRLEPNAMSFFIAGYASCPETSTAQLRDALEESLLQMQDCLHGHHAERDQA
ncbi:hypothetical protein ISCGN_011693 [Ixodes scapularis]